jgi:hypothetical protein
LDVLSAALAPFADAVAQQEEATREIAQNVMLAAQRSEQAAQNIQAVTKRRAAPIGKPIISRAFR